MNLKAAWATSKFWLKTNYPERYFLKNKTKPTTHCSWLHFRDWAEGRGQRHNRPQHRTEKKYNNGLDFQNKKMSWAT